MRKLWLVFLTAFALDQLSKCIIVSKMELGRSLDLLPFLSITYVTNTGIAFSLFRAGKYSNIIFAVFALLAIGVMAYIIRKDSQIPGGAQGALGGRITSLQKIALVLIIAGAAGNLTDRVFRGSVVDFIDCYYKGWHWPIFNFADSFVSIGAAIFAFTQIFPPKRTR